MTQDLSETGSKGPRPDIPFHSTRVRSLPPTTVTRPPGGPGASEDGGAGRTRGPGVHAVPGGGWWTKRQTPKKMAMAMRCW
jgi:hypothetical protein